MKPQCLILLGVFFFSFLSLTAQRDKLSLASTLGATTPILDAGFGLHLGLNPAYFLSPWFSFEGQLSFLHTRITSTFLSGNKGVENAGNALLGGRLYLAAAKAEFYLNFLFGVSYQRARINGMTRSGELGIGGSTGFFVVRDKIMGGLSLETPQHVVLKVGYVF